jgi:UDP-glucose 4-epimerase
MTSLQLAGSPGASTGKVIVIGGNSQLAQNLKNILPTNSVFLSRSVTEDNRDVAIATYANLDPLLLANASVVINCVGTAKGDHNVMARVNVDVAVNALESAKAAGVKHFIHISSLSVYGRITDITSKARELPVSVYGRTKKMADDALVARVDDNIILTVVRLPMLYAVSSSNKLKSLMTMWLFLGFFIMPRNDVKRSMISYQMASELICHIAKCPPAVQTVIAADPKPFSFKKVSRFVYMTCGITLRLLPLTDRITLFISRILPSLHDSILQSSLIDEQDNYAVQLGLKSRLYDDVSSMIVARQQ